MVTFLKTEDPLHQGQLPSHTVPGTGTSSPSVKARTMPHRITSVNHVIANGDQTTRFLLKKKQENYKYLTVKILKEQQQQHLAGLHFEAMYDHLLYMPSIVLTIMTGILGVLVKSTLVPSDRVQTFFALCIAAIAVISTFIQSLTKQLNLVGRAGFHESASTALKKLYERTELSSREAQYNSIHKALKTDTRLSVGLNLTQVIAAAEKEDASTDGSEEEGCNTAANVVCSPPEVDTKVDNKASDGTKESITSQFFQAVDGCSSVIPIKISHAFEMIDVRVNLVNKSMLKDKKHSKVNWSEVLPAIYYQLTQTFLEYPYFPVCLPQPKWSVDKALEDFKKSLESGEHNHADLASSLLDRGDNDDELV